MTKFLTAGALTSLAVVAFAMPASAITNEGECSVEGGTMIEVKGSDFCLVSIRDEAYADAVYDGNQLGVVDCPGDKLNDGKYCMYPVTIRPQTTAAAASVETSAVESASEMTEKEAKKAKKAAKKAAKEAAKN